MNPETLKNELAAIKTFFDAEDRKHPSFLLFDLEPTNFFRQSEEYCRELLGEWDSNFKILDVGCGDGTDAIVLAAKSNQVWGIDISQTRLIKAQEKVRIMGLEDRVHFDLMDANQLEFSDNFFDLIIGNSVLLFLDRERFSHECLRVLRPGGRALFSNESLANHPLLKLRRMLPSVRAREKIADRLNLAKIIEIGKIFTIVNHREFYLTSVLLSPFLKHVGKYEIAGSLLNALNKFDDFLIRISPMLRNYCWLSVIELEK